MEGGGVDPVNPCLLCLTSEGIGAFGGALRNLVIEQEDLRQMGEPILEPFVHLKVVESAVDVGDHHGRGLRAFHHVLEFSLAEVGIDRERYEACPLARNARKKPVDTVGRLNNDAG